MTLEHLEPPHLQEQTQLAYDEDLLMHLPHILRQDTQISRMMDLVQPAFLNNTRPTTPTVAMAIPSMVHTEMAHMVGPVRMVCQSYAMSPLAGIHAYNKPETTSREALHKTFDGSAKKR